MSNTPETEKVKAALHTNWHDLLNHARNLERERDEAREALASREVVMAQQNVITDLLLERDEAREKYATEATEHMLAVNKLCGERDEAQDYSKDIWKILQHSQDEVLRLTFKNRELSQSIEGWENKWKCAVDMAARAEIERDDAQEDAKLLAERLTALELQSTAELARLEQELINMKELYESNN